MGRWQTAPVTAWPALRVVGLEPWEPAMRLARMYFRARRRL
jgi:hypothetical protein